MTAEAASQRWDDEPAKPAQSEVVADADLVRVYLTEIAQHPLLTAEQEVEHAKAIEAGLYAEHKLGKHFDVVESGGDPRLTAEELELYAELVTQGEASKRTMLESNLRLVVSIAKRYRGRGMAMLDLIQEGNIGLIRGVEKFDYTKGYKFSTYATWWIRQAITRAMADQNRTIRLPVHMVEQVNKLGKKRQALEQVLGREPTIDELAKEAKLSPEKVQEILDYDMEPLSTDMTVDEMATTRFGDLIEDADAVDPAEHATQGALMRELHASLAAFTPGAQIDRNLDIMMRYFGFYGTHETLDSIGQVHGLSRERVRQITRETLRALREHRPDLKDYLD